MTKDRTNQLQAKSGINKGGKEVFSMEIEEEEPTEEASLTGNKINKIVKSKSKEKNSMEFVFTHVNETIAFIETMKETVVHLKRYHVSIQHSSRLDQKAREDNEKLNEIIKSTSMLVATKIRELESKKRGDPNNAINRVINTQKALLMKMHRDAIEEYEKALVAHRKNCEDIIKKELLIVIKKLITKMECVLADIHVNDEDLLAILDSEDTAVFVDNYMKETAEARELLQDVRDRHKEVLALEKDITMIKDMFFQLGYQVAQQGELVDRIEYHIGNGLVNATKGNKKLSKTRKTVGRIRKKKLYIIICITSVLGILIFCILVQTLMV
ncbi:syntaxin-1A-like isoform X2 [Rhodnius prolixus]